MPHNKEYLLFEPYMPHNKEYLHFRLLNRYTYNVKNVLVCLGLDLQLKFNN